MKMHLPLFLLVVLLPFAAPIATMTVFELGLKIIEMTKKLIELSLTVNDHANLIESSEKQKEDRLFDKLDNINLDMADINENLQIIGDDVSAIKRILSNLPEAIQLQLDLKALSDHQYFVDCYYDDMEKYIMNFNFYEKSTLLDFADSVVSSRSNSVPSLMKSINRLATGENFLRMISNQFRPGLEGYFCKKKQSLSDLYHRFLTTFLATNMKSYILMKASYMIKKLYKTGNFTRELRDVDANFKKQTNAIISKMKPYIEKSNLSVWRCDPDDLKHEEDKTYVQITNFLQGYILNKAHLDPYGGCREECYVYSYTKTQKCHGSPGSTATEWCKKETCPKVLNCQHIDSSMEVCSTSRVKDKRRYEYVEFGNGILFGKKKSCPNDRKKHLETYIYWLIWRCSYCYCLCDNEMFSDRYINLRSVIANTDDNRVVTGLRFVKHKKIIHLQIQEGKLLSYGKIDSDTVRWVPVEDYSITSKNYHKDKDYHTLTWEDRGFDLDDIMLKAGNVITGVKFVTVGSRLHLEVQSTPFNFTTGQLNTKNSFFPGDLNLQTKHSFGRELELIQTDVPTRAISNQLTTNKYVKFTNTGYDKDAGQTTVPFFDAQPVESEVPVPLSGVGIFHKGRQGFGGFLTPRIFTYNYAKHLEPLFRHNGKKKSRND